MLPLTGQRCFIPLVSHSVPTTSPAERGRDSQSASGCAMRRSTQQGSPSRARGAIIHRLLKGGNAFLKSKNTAMALRRRAAEKNSIAASASQTLSANWRPEMKPRCCPTPFLAASAVALSFMPTAMTFGIVSVSVTS